MDHKNDRRTDISFDKDVICTWVSQPWSQI